MATTIIKVQCIDQTLQITSKPVVASGGFNENIVEFSFCGLWNGFTKVAVFYQNAELPYFQPLDDNDACVIPWEVLAKDGEIHFGVFGENADGVTRTSALARYKIVRGAITDGLQPTNPTPELWTQVLAKAQEITATALDIADTAAKLNKQQSDFEETITVQQDKFEADNKVEINPVNLNWNIGGVDTGVLARATYVHFRWSEKMPTSDAELLDTPEAYIGIYNGISQTPPIDYRAYKWHKYVGDSVTTDVMRQLVKEHNDNADVHAAAFAAHNKEPNPHEGILSPFNHQHVAADVTDLVSAMSGAGFGQIATGSYVGDGSGSFTVGMELTAKKGVPDHGTCTYTGVTEISPRRIEFPFAPSMVMLIVDGENLPARVFYASNPLHSKGTVLFSYPYLNVPIENGAVELDEAIPAPIAYLEGSALCLCTVPVPAISKVIWDSGSGITETLNYEPKTSEITLSTSTETFNKEGVTYHYVAF